MSKRIVGLGVAIALVAAAAIVWSSRSPQPPAPDGAEAPRAAAPAEGAVDGCRFAPGQAHAFAFTSTTHAEVRPPLPGVHAEDAPVQVHSTELSGALALEVLEAGPTDAVLLARLSGVNEQAQQLLGDALQAPFLVAVDARCEVTRVARHQATPKPQARAHGVVAHQLAFSLPRAQGAEERTFMTAVGVQRALVLPGHEAGQLLRKALGYASRWNPSLAQVDVADGEVVVQRGASRWFDSLRGLEVVAGGPVVRSTTEWSAQAVPPSPAALAGASRTQADYVWENPFAEDAQVAEAAASAPSQDHQRRVAAQRDVAFPVAIDRFEVLLSSGANINEQWRDMAAFLDAHPEQVPAFVEHITHPGFPSGRKAAAFLALGQARTPAARDALLGVWHERSQQPADRMRSSLALALRGDVGAPLARELKAEAVRSPGNPAEADVSRQAVLHLGVLAGSRPSDQEVTDEATALVQQLSSTARTPQDWAVLFGLVGNMADGTLLPQVAAWTNLQSPDIRQHVPRALRRYKVERVHDLVVQWLAREKSADVKRELFNVLHHMYVDANRPIEEDLMREALAHLREQPLVLTRQSLLHLLAPFVGTHPEVHEAFKAQLKVELEARSGLYSLVTEYLPAASIYEVLATVPRLSHQFGGTLKPGVAAPPPAPQEVPIPELPLPNPDAHPQANLGSAP